MISPLSPARSDCLGTEPSWDLMQGCDTLLMVGTGFPWSEFLPKDGGARAVQIDIEASMLSLRYPAEVNLHGDAADTLKALLPLIRRKHDRDWSKKIEANVAAWWEKLEGRATADADPVNPQRVLWETVAAGKRHRHQRQRTLRQLVCPRSPGAAGAVSIAVGRPGLHGCSGALRHRRQVRPSRPSGERPRG